MLAESGEAKQARKKRHFLNKLFEPQDDLRRYYFGAPVDEVRELVALEGPFLKG